MTTSTTTVYGASIVAAVAITISAHDVDPSIALTFMRAVSIITTEAHIILTPNHRRHINLAPHNLVLPRHSKKEARMRLEQFWKDATGFKSWDDARRFGDSPLEWGPVMWQALHDLSVFFDCRGASRPLKTLLQTLPALLPCAKCRKHVAGHLIALAAPIAGANTRMAFVDVVTDFHNRASIEIKGIDAARIYPMLSELRPQTLIETLVLLRNHGRSSVQGFGESRESCGCSQRASLAEGKLWAQK
jgi:hypothetical protein